MVIALAVLLTFTSLMLMGVHEALRKQDFKHFVWFSINSIVLFCFDIIVVLGLMDK